MPNAVAYVALAIWPVVAYLLFRGLSRPAALTWAILGGYLLLPFGVGIDLPMVPPIDKSLIAALAATALCFVSVGKGGDIRQAPVDASNTPYARNRAGPSTWSTKREGHDRAEVPKQAAEIAPVPVWIDRFLVLLVLFTPFVTVAQNSEPVLGEAGWLPGLTSYDAVSMALAGVVSILPYLLARRFLSGDREHILLLTGLGVAGVLYSLPSLFEVRMSPQLSKWIYGFLAQSFGQAIRNGGFRPVVFLQHGLWLAIFLAMSLLAAAILWRLGSQRRKWLVALIWLLLTLALCKSLGGLTIAILLLPAVAFMSVRWQLLLAGMIAGIFVSYPVLRGAQIIPTAEIATLAESLSADRAGSLRFRFDNEDSLLARAAEKPLAGWGGWARSRVHDEETGENASITDGIWVIVIGQSGWLGYLGTFGLLTTPILVLGLRSRKATSLATSGLCLVLAANLIDMVPNATLTPITWLIAGALAGHARMSKAMNPVGGLSTRSPRSFRA